MIGSKSTGFVNQAGKSDHDFAKPSQIVRETQVNQINPAQKSSILITKVPSKSKASVIEPVSDDDTTTPNPKPSKTAFRQMSLLQSAVLDDDTTTPKPSKPTFRQTLLLQSAVCDIDSTTPIQSGTIKTASIKPKQVSLEEHMALAKLVKELSEQIGKKKEPIESFIYNGKDLCIDIVGKTCSKWALRVARYLFTEEELEKNTLMVCLYLSNV
jgi:hypothetical protein